MATCGQHASTHIRTLRLILWLIVLAPTALFLLWLFDPLNAHDNALPSPARHCLSNMKNLAISGMLYASDYDDRLPVAPHWSDELAPYFKDRTILDCPKIVEEKKQQGLKGQANATYGYAYNNAVATCKTTTFKHATATVMFFESSLLRKDAAGGTDLLPIPGRHDGANSIAFADGHAKRVQPEESLIWKY